MSALRDIPAATLDLANTQQILSSTLSNTQHNDKYSPPPLRAKMGTKEQSKIEQAATPQAEKAAVEYVIKHGTEEHRQISSMIGSGNSGMVHLLPCGTRIRKSVAIWRMDTFVLKMQAKDLRKEIAVYKHLPEEHRRFLRMYESVDDGNLDVSLTLDYLPNNTLHEYLRGFTFKELMNTKAVRGEKDGERERRLRRRHDSIPLRDRARWVLEATDGIIALHAHDVIHCDIKPENMGLDAQLSVRIFDFAGSSLPDQPPLCAESRRYFMPRESWDVYNAKTDLFALGSSIYHIVTGVQPYDSVPDDDVKELFERGEFPDLSAEGAALAGGSKGADDTNGTSPVRGELVFAETIRKCWHGEFAAATDVMDSLKTEVVQTFDEQDVKYVEEASGITINCV